MKKLICGFLTFLWLITCASAQQIQVVWEKTYSWLQDDQVSAIEKLDNGYIAKGFRGSRSLYYGGSSNAEFMLIWLNEQGDTIKMQPMGVFSPYSTSGNALKKGPDGDILNAVYIVDTVGLDRYTLRLYKISQSGQMRWFKDYQNSKSYYARSICVLGDGGALIVGNCNYYGTDTARIVDGFAIRVDPNGQELWRKTYHPSIITNINHAEILNGTSDRFLISGNAGQYIWCAWIKDNGTFITDRKVYYDSSNTQLYDAGVMQSPNGHLVAWGRNSANPRKSYLGIYDINGITKHYGKSSVEEYSVAYVNSNSQILLGVYNSINQGVFRKYDPSGILLDSTILSNASNNLRVINAAAWTNGDSAVFAGRSRTDRNNFMDDFYFVKIAGVGLEYIAATPSIVSEKAITLYPNPARDWFSVSGAGEITLYTTSGQVVLSQQVKPEEKVSMANLPQGLYVYRFVSGKQVTSGKVVRE